MPPREPGGLAGEWGQEGQGADADTSSQPDGGCPCSSECARRGGGVWKDYYSVTMSLQKEKLFKSKNELLNFVMKRPDFTV